VGIHSWQDFLANAWLFCSRLLVPFTPILLFPSLRYLQPAVTATEGQCRHTAKVMGCLHDPANVQQTSSKCIQNARAIAVRLLDRANILWCRRRLVEAWVGGLFKKLVHYYSCFLFQTSADFDFGFHEVTIFESISAWNRTKGIQVADKILKASCLVYTACLFV